MSRNVALIVLDTVRKDYFDEYAPRLRERSDLSFEQCRAASSWSVPSHASIVTGTYPHRHGIHAESFDSTFSFTRLDADSTFLGRLPEHRTVGLSANAYVNSFFDFDALFDEFHDFSIGSHTNESLFTEALTVEEFKKSVDENDQLQRYLQFLSACLSHDAPRKSLANGLWSQVGQYFRHLPLPELVDDGASVISQTSREAVDDADEPFFLFANYMDAHTPLRNLRQYDQDLHSAPNSWSSTDLDKWELNRDDKSDETYRENYRELYGAAIDYLDRRVSALVDDVQARTAEETTFVVVSDHGHNLGFPADDGQFHHTSTMTEGVLHTPCEVINPPPGYPQVEPRYFSHVDLGELIAGLANGDPYDKSLVGDTAAAETVGLVGADDGTWGRDFSDDEFAYWNRMIRCFYDGTTKYQWNSLGDVVRYDLNPDVASWQSLADEDVALPDAATESFSVDVQEYKERAGAVEQSLEFDGQVESHLEDLGYL